MKKNKEIRINPVGLKGNQISERMKELMGINSINENKSSIVVELTKVGPDGKAYAIIRENHVYYIKTNDKTGKLIAEDFKYIGGLQNKTSEAYPSYAKAIKHLNLKFRNLAEAYNFEGDINIFVDDNLLSEAGIGGFSNFNGNGFSGEGNLQGNTELTVESEDVEEEEVELTEEEKAVDAMNEQPEEDELKNDADPKEQPGYVHEHKLSILRALENMDAIIDGLTDPNVKKKVYTIR